jgi:hypothetical protein
MIIQHKEYYSKIRRKETKTERILLKKPEKEPII